MKRVTLLFLSLFFTIASWSNLRAQNSNEISFGGGVTYGVDFEEVGLQAVGTYSLSNKIRVGVDFIYWLTQNETAFGSSFSSTLFEINGNLHYLFYNSNDFVIYAIGTLGIHYASVSVDIPGFG